MKFFCFLLLLISPSLFTPDLAQIRKDFILATNNRESALDLMDKLEPLTKDDNKILVAYKGAVMALSAKYSKENEERKNLFKNGISFLEYAVSQKPENIEIRCLRLSIQENSPKFLKYKSNIQEDKTFILNHYKKTNSQLVKDFVKSFILQSTEFNTEEKQGF
ncbi:hypothetical protein MWU78_05570 [Arenibacter sp. F26102]|uniref:hypothetical protein n=1 Tax=Arenibacter sp. F26102 TaxID=2926416 RepID=UPI001FF41BB1|nr:hypothetical protein [Arenibacter sp. F26102]MCK0145109.1 hypothetical protein [Arenibacter sp. F26102]